MIPAKRRCPYVGLVPYSEADWPFFFGRETETELIIANLVASRLTLLFGASGVGKSSVLRAGVAHRLTDQARKNRASSGTPEAAVVVFSAWRDDPLAALTRSIRESVAHAVGYDSGDSGAPRRLADLLQDWVELVGGEILVVLDQFEEYLMYHGREDGEGKFAVEFPRLVNSPGLRVNFLVAIREDSVARLDRFKGRIPNLFDNYLRLQHLSVPAGEEAIRRPLAAFNKSNLAEPVEIDNELVQEVLRQTRTDYGRADQGAQTKEVSGGAEATLAQIETPYLQMVMTRLWEQEEKAGSHILRLATFVEDPPTGLGGADRIVRSHLDGEMESLDPSERDVAAQAFRFLVTRTGSKIALAVDDLAGYTSLPSEKLAPVLDKLTAGGRRILRPVPVPQRPDIIRYEIFHDVLGPAITDWRRRSEAVKQQEAIRREQEERSRKELEDAEARRQRDRSRYQKLGLIFLSTALLILLFVSWFAWQQRLAALDESERAQNAMAQAQDESRKARFALAQAQQAAREAEAAARAAIEARSAQARRVEPSGAAMGSRLREAFLSGDTDKAVATARDLGLLNETARFRAQRVSQNYGIEQGQIYEFSMQPLPDSFAGGLRSLAAVTFKMNHPTFRNQVLTGDPKRNFRTSYIGWGCLTRVPVLLEYADPRRAPELAVFDMCDNLETVSR
ncbi:MAG: hypothetical protein GEU77_04760 [Deltaproteobacteria bacterium]|nr:hypothetical protein [Deltaproteobacteria bacterium]